MRACLLLENFLLQSATRVVLCNSNQSAFCRARFCRRFQASHLTKCRKFFTLDLAGDNGTHSNQVINLDQSTLPNFWKRASVQFQDERD